MTQGKCEIKMRLFLFWLSICLVLPVPVLAQPYRYIDKDGSIHFVDDLSKIPAGSQDSVQQVPSNISKIPARKYEPLAIMHPDSAAKIQVFLADWCPICRSLEQYLTAKKVRYRRMDIDKSPEARKQFLELGGGGIPVIKAGSKVLRGFDRAQVNELLGLK